MKAFRGQTAEEIIVARFDPGDDLVPALASLVSDMDLAGAAIVSGSGTLERVHLESPGTLAWPSPIIATEKQGPAQIISAQGLVLAAGVEVYLAVSRRGDHFAGQAREGCPVLHTAELVLLRPGKVRWSRVDSPAGVPEFIAEELHAPGRVVELMGRRVDPAAVALVPPMWIRRYGCMPVARGGDTLVVAMADPENHVAINDLRQRTGLQIKPMHVPLQEIAEALTKLFTHPPERPGEDDPSGATP